MKQLQLALPKGSLQETATKLFQDAGWEIVIPRRSDIAVFKNDSISCELLKPREIPEFIADGSFDVGITGLDCILETGFEKKVEEITKLPFSKSSLNQAKWVVAVKEGSPISELKDLEGRIIATELPNFTKRFLKQKGIRNVTVRSSLGATEAKLRYTSIDAIVELTETKETIRKHGLRIVCNILTSTPILIANTDSMHDVWKSEKIEQLATMLNAVLNAKKYTSVKMNTQKHNLEKVLEVLEGGTPTISRLDDDKGYAIEILVESGEVRNLLHRLKLAGAEKIFTTKPELLIP